MAGYPKDSIAVIDAACAMRPGCGPPHRTHRIDPRPSELVSAASTAFALASNADVKNYAAHCKRHVHAITNRCNLDMLCATNKPMYND